MARRILVEGGTACGVEIETGTRASRRLVQVRAGVVVSNADLLLTLERLVGREHLSTRHTSPASARCEPRFPAFSPTSGSNGVRRCSGKRRATTGRRGTAMGRDEGLQGIRADAVRAAMAPPGGQIADCAESHRTWITTR